RPQCRKASLLFFDARGNFSAVLGGPTLAADLAFQLPTATAQPMDDLPELIEQDRLEAWSCFFGGNLRASLIIGRAAIQRAARHLKAEGAGLKAELADLLGKGTITSELKKWADEVRIAGDDAAH